MSGIKQEMQWIQQEAERCLYCIDAPCRKGCPASVNVPQFIRSLRYSDLRTAVKEIKDFNPLGSICGDLCPSEKLCQKNCTLNCSGRPISIRELQKFVCANAEYRVPIAEELGKKVAVIGAGPAGLACSETLARKGISVEVFDKAHEPSGVIAREIPEFRIPAQVVQKDVNELTTERIRFHFDTKVNKADILEKYLKEFDAVFVGVGLSEDRMSGVDIKEGAANVYGCSQFLSEIKSNVLEKVTGSVCVIGGGNSAMDAARAALAAGADRAMLAYRRSRFEMPACDEELLDTAASGVELMYMVSPKTIEKSGDWLKVTFVRNRLEEIPGESRKGFKTIEGSEFTMDFDTVVMAIGKTPGEISFNKKQEGNSLRNLDTNCFIGGDLINGGGTVVEAVRDGIKAAEEIFNHLMK